MKKFNGVKDIEQIMKDAKELGYEVDLTCWVNGSDWYWIRDMSERMIQIMVNYLGNFFVYMPCSENPIATEKSECFDTLDWYQEIFNLIYKEEEK